MAAPYNGEGAPIPGPLSGLRLQGPEGSGPLQCLRQDWVVSVSPESSWPCSFAFDDTHLPNAFLPFLPVPYCCANVLPPCVAPKSASDCARSALHSLAAFE